jgi:hypothetical protein
MVRISKQAERRSKSHRRPKAPQPQTGPRKEARGFNPHENALSGEAGKTSFIPKIR